MHHQRTDIRVSSIAQENAVRLSKYGEGAFRWAGHPNKHYLTPLHMEFICGSMYATRFLVKKSA